jgi:hypothetical protein
MAKAAITNDAKEGPQVPGRFLNSTHLVSTNMSRAMVYPTTSLEMQSGGFGNVVLDLARGRGSKTVQG